MLDPRMQIFNLTDRCNNACSFCICRRHLTEGIGDSSELVQKKIAAIPRDGIIDIFGGEPTLSDHFMEIVREAKRKNAFTNIATNARSFAQATFFNAFVDETRDYRGNIFIRSSLHGHTATIHERHTNRRGSFAEAIEGIKNLKQAGYEVSVNTVVTRHNYRHLAEIHALIARWGVDVFKLSFMRFTIQHLANAVTLDDLKKALPEVIETVAASGMGIDLDTIPYCVAPDQLALYAKDENSFIENDRRVVKLIVCNSCPVKAICCGVDREYFEHYGGEELKVISDEQMNRFRKTSGGD